jgi:hypothetical protein
MQDLIAMADADAKQNPASSPTNPNAKPAENAPVGSFEELLKLDPKKVKFVRVVPKK